jgi:hypothetical protein
MDRDEAIDGRAGTMGEAATGGRLALVGIGMLAFGIVGGLIVGALPALAVFLLTGAAGRRRDRLAFGATEAVAVAAFAAGAVLASLRLVVVV